MGSFIFILTSSTYLVIVLSYVIVLFWINRPKRSLHVRSYHYRCAGRDRPVRLFYQGCYEVRRGEMDEYEERVNSIAECNETCYNQGFQYFTAKQDFLVPVDPIK